MNDSCIGLFKGLFIDKSGNVLGNSIQFNTSQSDTSSVVLSIIGNLYKEEVGHTANKLNPIRVFDGDKLFLSTKNINCQSGQHYNIEFVMSDSMLYSGLQLNIPYDSSLLILDTIYSNLNLKSRDYHKSIGDVKIAWVNFLNPILGSIAPSLSLGFTAKKDFILSDAIRDDYQSISNFAMDNNFKVRPIKIDFSDINQNHESASEANYIFCFPNPTTENVSIVGKMESTSNCTMDIYDAGGLLTNRQLLNLSDGRIQHEIRFEHNGLYLVKIISDNGTTLTHKILVSK
ncbi:MAG: T9SS type A sorting domain-containing protein [Saprospiraceae bacterium]|nr:T9SS type A sorting domain-containing protein [Candidatus Vicinibacter affinis]